MALKLKQKILLSIISGVIIFIAVGFSVRPVYKKLTDNLQNISNNFQNKIQEKLGIKIEFDKVSPSFLKGINIYELNFYENDILIAHVKKIKLAYSFKNIFNRKTEKFLDYLLIDNITVDYNQMQNSVLTQKIAQLIASDSSENQSFDFENFKLDFNLPLDIIIKNFKTRIETDFMNIETNIKNAHISEDSEQSRFMCKFSGDINFMSFNDIKTTFELDANITKKISDSVVQLKFLDVSNKSFSLIPLQLVLRSSENKILMSLIQKQQKGSVSLSYDIPQKKIAAHFSSDGFKPFEIIKIKDKKSKLNMFTDTRIDGFFDGDFYLGNHESLYNASLVLSSPKKIISDGIRADIKFNGNSSNANIELISVKSKIFSGFYEGSFDIKTLQPFGNFTIENITLPNGNSFQTAMYFDPLVKGFQIFVPQLELNQTLFTAVQAELIPDNGNLDFYLEIPDYMNATSDVVSKLSLSGSYQFLNKKYLQSQISADGFSLDTIFNTLEFFLDKNAVSSLSSLHSFFKPFVMSADMFVSSDFDEIVYNVPYVIAANSQENRQMAMLSFDGNESSVNVSYFDIIYGSQNVNLNVIADFNKGFKDLAFNSVINFNGIPYELSGILEDGKNLSVKGNYDLLVNASFDKNNIQSAFSMSGLPVSIYGYLLNLSLDSTLESNNSQWKMNLDLLEVTETQKLLNKPRLLCSGNLNNYGLMLENIEFSDSLSILSGNGSSMWSFIDGVPETFSVLLDLQNQITEEMVSVNAQASNPLKYSFNDTDFLSQIFFNISAIVKNMPSSRLLNNQGTENRISFDAASLGSINNPAATLDVKLGSFLLNGINLGFQGKLLLEDGFVSSDQISVSYGKNVLKNIKLALNLNNFDTLFSADFENEQLKIFAPLKLSFESLEKRISPEWKLVETKIPAEFIVKMEIPTIESENFGKIDKIDMTLVRQNKTANFFIGEQKKIYGFFKENGEINIAADKSLPCSFNASGLINTSTLDVDIQDLILDTSKFKQFVNFSFFSLVTGIVRGNLHLGGVLSDPEFSGLLTAADFEFACRDFLAENLKAPSIVVNAQKNTIGFDKTLFSTKKFDNAVEGALKISFDRWYFDQIQIDVKTTEKKYVKGRFVMDFMEYTADAIAKLDINARLDSCVVKGSLIAENAEAVFSPFTRVNTSVSGDFATILDLDVIVGHRSQIYVPTKRSPMVRGLIEPNTSISVKMDTTQNFFELKGDLVLRGGEVSYGSRNFYLREGRLVLNENANQFDPAITVRAETRERDSNNKLVTIILSAKNQHFSNFIPSFSASPAKSEQEIMEIMGMSFTENMNTNNMLPSIFAMGSDMLLQMTLFKQMENSLREFFNFDILSMRTSILQNAMNNVLNQSDSEKTFSIGNLLDNTNVYIGKYFGNALYADFLGQFSVEGKTESNEDVLDRLIFRPEIGFEMASPFANIRMNLESNMNFAEFLNTNDKNDFKLNTSITLSWKFEL